MRWGCCYKEVGELEFVLWGKGWRGDILNPLCACVGEPQHPAPLPPSETDLFVVFILNTLAL